MLLPPMEKIVVVAMTADRVIGREGRIPWHLPEELRLFKELTWGETVIMGRLTFESIGRPLPGRRNIVVSRTLPDSPGIEICPSLDAALECAGKDRGGKIFFIGGAELYRRAIEVADTLIVSWVDGVHAGDTFFPEIDFSLWREIECHRHPQFRICTYGRRGEPARLAQAERSSRAD